MLSHRENIRTSKFWRKSKEKKRIFFYLPRAYKDLIQVKKNSKLFHARVPLNILSQSSRETRSLYNTFVELFKQSLVVHQLQNPPLCSKMVEELRSNTFEEVNTFCYCPVLFGVNPLPFPPSLLVFLLYVLQFKPSFPN